MCSIEQIATRRLSVTTQYTTLLVCPGFKSSNETNKQHYSVASIRNAIDMCSVVQVATRRLLVATK